MFGSSNKFCKSCGYSGSTKRFMPGSIIIEIVMWCAFLIPGIIYTLWRHSAEVKVCGKCGSKEVIPLDSPIAQEYLNKKN